MGKNHDSLPTGGQVGSSGLPRFLASTVWPRIEQNGHNSLGWFSKLSPWLLDSPLGGGSMQGQLSPNSQGHWGSLTFAPILSWSDRPVIVMLQVEWAGLSQHLRASAVLATLYSLPGLLSVIPFKGLLLPSNGAIAVPLTPTVLPSLCDSASLAVNFPKIWLLGACLFLPKTPRPSCFCLSLHWAIGPVHISYCWTLPLLRSAGGMLPLPRSLFLILSWNDTFFEALITRSTYNDAMKLLCPYYSDPNTCPTSKSQVPWDNKQNLIQTDISSSKHGAEYMVDVSLRIVACLWSLWRPEHSIKDVLYVWTAPSKAAVGLPIWARTDCILYIQALKFLQKY